SGLHPHNLELKEVAGSYVEQLLRVQPIGPIALLGWSSGGLLAYEMARQLETLSRELDFLILLDTEFPTAARNGEADDFTLQSEQQLLQQLLPRPVVAGGKQPNDLSQLWQSLAAQAGQDERMTQILGDLVQQELYPGKSDYSAMSVQEQITYVNAIRTIRRMTVRYQPVPLHREWYFVKAAASAVPSDLQAYSTREVHLLELPGDHYSMMQWPAVSAVVELLESLG
ncbi:MAG: hypothetical protein KDC44_24895, partial [Phaeodactylibacter sp.]|nr:hypothetical protein [Phaeodactylibacter sp.]